MLISIIVSINNDSKNQNSCIVSAQIKINLLLQKLVTSKTKIASLAL